MSSSNRVTSESTTPAPRTRPHPAFSALVGLTTLGVLLQGLWAGLLRTDDRETWVTVHARGAEITLVLAVLAVVAAVVWMRHNRPALIGSVLLLVLLVVQYFLGRAVSDSVGSYVVHVPLAMLLMALAVYLPVLARR